MSNRRIAVIMGGTSTLLSTAIRASAQYAEHYYNDPSLLIPNSGPVKPRGKGKVNQDWKR